MVDNKQVKRVNTGLRQQIFQKFGVLGLAFMVMGSVAFLGFQQARNSHAETVGTLSIIGTNTNVVGTTFSADLYEDSGTDNVNAVQAALNYDSSKLQFVSVSEGTAFPTVAATSTSTAGVIRLGRGTSSGTTVNGKNVIAHVTFRVLQPGNTSVVFDPTYSLLVRGTDNTSILNSFQNLDLKLQLPAPSVSSLSPASYILNSSPSVPTVTITGTNFVQGATISVGNTAASNVNFVSSTQLTASFPSLAAGSYPVTVSNPDGQNAVKSGAFSYINAAPTVSSLSPTTGSTKGGAQVTIVGSNLDTITSVTFDGVSAAINTKSSGQVSVTAPVHAAGAVNVTVTGPNGSATKTGAFTYVAPAPTISSIAPITGPYGGGTSVTITGTDFVSGAKVSLGGSTTYATTFISATALKLTMPTSPTTNLKVPVVVTNPDGQSATLTSAYTYYAVGDANGDGRVNALDLSMLIAHDGQNYQAADFNGDGTVGAADMAILLSKWTW